MTKSKKAVTGTEWEETGARQTFPPLWKPVKKGEFIIGVPLAVKTSMFGKGKKRKPIHNIDFLLRDMNTDNFFSGSKKKKTLKKADVAKGDIISIPGSYALSGEEKVYVDNGKTATLSPIAKKLSKQEKSMKIEFDGKVDLKSGNQMKTYKVYISKK